MVKEWGNFKKVPNISLNANHAPALCISSLKTLDFLNPSSRYVRFGTPALICSNKLFSMGVGLIIIFDYFFFIKKYLHSSFFCELFFKNICIRHFFLWKYYSLNVKILTPSNLTFIRRIMLYNSTILDTTTFRAFRCTRIHQMTSNTVLFWKLCS